MTTKKKKKTSMNAIDKYLQQKKYSRGKKTSDAENPQEKVVKTTVSRINKGKAFPDRNVRRSARSVSASTLEEKSALEKVSEFKTETEYTNSKKKNSLKKSKKVLLIKSIGRQEAEGRHLENKLNRRKKEGNRGSKNQSKTQSQIKGNKKSQVEKDKSTNQKKRSKKLDKVENFSQTTTSILSNEPSVNSAKTLDGTDRLGVPNIGHEVTESVSTTEMTITEGSSQVTHQQHATELNKPVKKKRKVEFSKVECSSVRNAAPVNEPCCSYVSSVLEDQSSDTQIAEETTPITKKYQPYMERLKLLTSDAIKKFITDNQQYYVDFKKEVESRTTTPSASNKKWKKSDEMRESFKCNPFNSDQQLAMYYTLREIFKVPKAHFKECRNFFTVLIPEISCQLFAETFRIKVSFAPRLIKKLYPNPVCPI